MKSCITGVAGMLGSHLCDYLLQKKHKVWGIDNLSRGNIDNIDLEKFCFIQGDLQNKQTVNRIMERGKFDVVYHLAAFAAEGQSVYMPAYTIKQNLVSFANLISACINNNVKHFIHVSSMSIYGKGKIMGFESPEFFEGFTEDMIPAPEDPYAMTKAMIEDLLIQYSKAFGFNYTIIRPHNIVGPRSSLNNPYRNVIGIWINRLLNGKPPIIYGDGKQKRSFTHVDDLIPWIAKMPSIKKARNETFNLGSDEVFTINEACDIVLDKMGSDLKPIHTKDRMMEVKNAYCNHDKAKKLLGYHADVSFEDGIEKMCTWAKKIGPQPFDYAVEQFEVHRKIHPVWKKKVM